MSAALDLSVRPVGDFYATPSHCTEALLAADAPPIGRLVWEPACGDGAIVKVLRAAGYDVVATDLYDRGCPASRTADFLAAAGGYAGSIVTNPPFNLADQFAAHALSKRPDYLALFGRLSWLEGRARHSALWGVFPPSRVWVFSGRQTLWRGDDPAAKTSGVTTAYAWFVWDRAATGGPVLGWLQTPKRGAR